MALGYNVGTDVNVASKERGSAHHQQVEKLGVSPATTLVTDVSTTSGEILAADADRMGGYLMNISDVIIYIGFGTETATNNYTPIKAGGSFPLEINGHPIVSAITARHYGSGNKEITIVTI